VSKTSKKTGECYWPQKIRVQKKKRKKPGTRRKTTGIAEKFPEKIGLLDLFKKKGGGHKRKSEEEICEQQKVLVTLL